jgi:leader peptidase (prepilin peptidase) / N-methyltransferase
MGSYVAALTQRWGQGEANRGRSRCDSCGRTLSVQDLVPVISYLVLRGKCRTCGVSIGARALWVELAAALIGALAFGLNAGLIGLGGALFGWTLLALFLLDVEQFWLPDRITLPLGALGLAMGLGSFQDRLIGLGAGFLALELIRRSYAAFRGVEGMGGGDPKLFAAIGAWLGWFALPFVLLGASVIGLGAAIFLASRGQDLNAKSAMPFGALMAIAAFAYWIAVVGGLSFADLIMHSMEFS